MVTNDDRLADRVRLMHAHGERTRYHHEVVGTTGRLDALQAAILRVKLRRLEQWNERRRRVGAALTQALANSPVTPPAPVRIGGDHVFHQFVVESDDRDRLCEHLGTEGISTAIHYPIPVHRTAAYQGSAERLPIAERLAGRICSLPMHPSMTDSEVQRIAEAVQAFAS